MNDVLLVAVLHRRYNLLEEKKNKQSLVKCLVFRSQTAIKDVVEEEEEEEMWLTLTRKMKDKAG